MDLRINAAKRWAESGESVAGTPRRAEQRLIRHSSQARPRLINEAASTGSVGRSRALDGPDHAGSSAEINQVTTTRGLGRDRNSESKTSERQSVKSDCSPAKCPYAHHPLKSTTKLNRLPTFVPLLDTPLFPAKITIFHPVSIVRCAVKRPHVARLMNLYVYIPLMPGASPALKVG